MEGAEMELTRIYTGDDGTSHFEEIALNLKEFEIGALSRQLRPTSVIVRVSEPGLVNDWHTAPGKTMIFVMTGAVQTEVSNGETRRFDAGGICYAEDVEGPGHLTTDLEGPRMSLMVSLPDDFDVHKWSRSFDD